MSHDHVMWPRQGKQWSPVLAAEMADHCSVCPEEEVQMDGLKTLKKSVSVWGHGRVCVCVYMSVSVSPHACVCSLNCTAGNSNHDNSFQCYSVFPVPHTIKPSDVYRHQPIVSQELEESIHSLRLSSETAPFIQGYVRLNIFLPRIPFTNRGFGWARL